MTMDITVKNNARWLSYYKRDIELNRLGKLDFIQELQRSHIRIADIGCGNGRSVLLLKTLFPDSNIIAIDKISENIDYARKNILAKDVHFEFSDIYEFLSKTKTNIRFDLILFSWSFFDMVNSHDQRQKHDRLIYLLDLIRDYLTPNGVILVLQPTKGGTFEKLLSMFIPSSDKDYAFTHNFLLESGFTGPNSMIPNQSDSLAIWSAFDYTNENELFSGISSVLMLELGETLSKKQFYETLRCFRKQNDLEDHARLTLTDCVNIYYKRY